MSAGQTLRALVNERLTAAAEDIFVLFERTIAEYEEQLCRSKEENERKQQLLDSVLSPRVLVHRADHEIPMTLKVEAFSSTNQEYIDCPRIKEEPHLCIKLEQDFPLEICNGIAPQQDPQDPMQISQECAELPLAATGDEINDVGVQSRRSKMESVNIEKKLKEGIYITKRKQGKSDIWQTFSVVCDNDGNELDFVRCDKCAKIHAYSGHRSGTSGLRRHICSGLPGQSKMKSKKKPQLHLPKRIKQETTEKCVKLCCLDIRPYDVIAGKGFVDISQHLVDVAAKYGHFDVHDILPHPTTVSRHAEEQARALLASVAAEIKPIIEEYGCAITADIWTDDYHKASFVSGTIHYINNNFDLVSRVLFAAPFESGVSTGENIRSLLFQKLFEFGIDASLLSSRVVFVTDHEAEIVAALRGNTRLNCNTHILNVTLSSAFAPCVLAETEISELLTNAKQLVKYFKHSGLQNNLKKPLEQSIETRWNSNYDMLDSILQQYDEISTMLLRNYQYDRIAQINADTLKTVVSFLKVFNEATNDLESDNATPSTSLPLPWSARLIEHCQAATLEPLLSKVADVCVSRLEELMGTCEASASPLHMMYRIATLLTPKMRLLQILPADAKEDVLKGAKEMITKMHFDFVPATAEGEPSAKKPKNQDQDEFADWEDDVPFASEPKSVDAEMDEYLSITLSEDPDPDSVLQWWKYHKEHFPALSKLARFIFSIPASSGPSERAFSVCGRSLEDRRTGLAPLSVKNILFLHSNIEK